MTIEIHKPELEQRVREQIQSGRFNDRDELLEKALGALEKNETAAVPPPRRVKVRGMLKRLKEDGWKLPSVTPLRNSRISARASVGVIVRTAAQVRRDDLLAARVESQGH